ncbi:MAG: hypothetical protein FWE03_04310 [Firmicutes bacterium]|nr:hypothetical protein [Bacillota bacterium]
MKKKLIVLLSTFIIIFISIIGFSGCGYTYQDGDFLLTVIADRAEVKVGETIEFTVRFENNSGRRLRVNSDQIFRVATFHKNEQPDFVVRGGHDSIIERDEIIEKTFYWEAEEIGERYAQGLAQFNILGNQTSWGIMHWYRTARSRRNATQINILSEKISITISN